MNIRTVNGKVLFTSDNLTVKEAVEKAVSQDADLQGAYLRSADLRGADLRGADLRGADLRGAYFRSAYLQDAYLRVADLQGADLQGAYLRSADLRSANLQDAYLRDADLRGADLQGAYLRSAYLQDADLQGADLQGADLQGAYLRSADLRGADLRGADLRGADLRGAAGFNPLITTPLHVLSEQVGRVRAYKLVNGSGEGPQVGGLIYNIGEFYEVDNANTDPSIACAPGLHVATLDWCLNNWSDGDRVLVVEFDADDIAAIPHGSNGKFRVHRLTVVGEKVLSDIGIDN